MIYEFRCYEAVPGRLPDLDRRFRDLTWPLLEKHGFRQVGFWIPEGTDQLVYLLAWQDEEEAKDKWKAFNGDPEWKKGKVASDVNGPLLAGSSSTFWRPTECSHAK